MHHNADTTIIGTNLAHLSPVQTKDSPCNETVLERRRGGVNGSLQAVARSRKALQGVARDWTCQIARSSFRTRRFNYSSSANHSTEQLVRHGLTPSRYRTVHSSIKRSEDGRLLVRGEGGEINSVAGGSTCPIRHWQQGVQQQGQQEESVLWNCGGNWCIR